jgi:phage terminase small subunit
MDTLRNPRHEKFSQLLASGVKLTQAYISSGYSEKGAAQSASNLLNKTEVAARVSELKEMAAYSSAQESVLSRTRVLNRLDHLSRKAENAGQLSVAARCEELLGKELGMFVERSEQQQTIKRLEDVPQEVLEEAIRRGEERLRQIEAEKLARDPSDNQVSVSTALASSCAT